MPLHLWGAPSQFIKDPGYVGIDIKRGCNHAPHHSWKASLGSQPAITLTQSGTSLALTSKFAFWETIHFSKRECKHVRRKFYIMSVLGNRNEKGNNISIWNSTGTICTMWQNPLQAVYVQEKWETDWETIFYRKETGTQKWQYGSPAQVPTGFLHLHENGKLPFRYFRDFSHVWYRIPLY